MTPFHWIAFLLGFAAWMLYRKMVSTGAIIAFILGILAAVLVAKVRGK